MMRICLVIGIVGCTALLIAQSNYIFNGGPAMGFAAAQAHSSSNNSIFGGGREDGFDLDMTSTNENGDIYGGGSEDGYDVDGESSVTNSKVYRGGRNDGFDVSSSGTEINGLIYAGGNDDGYSADMTYTEDNGHVFDGGSDDGFGQSLLSESVWTGDVGHDWLMAGNWSSGIVPTINHRATIPPNVLRYPELHGLMLVGIPGPHTYTAKTIWIQPGGAVYGLDGSKVLVGSEITLGGLLDLR